MHRQHGHAHIHGVDAQTGCGDGTDGRSARHVIIAHKALHRHASLVARCFPQRHCGGIGGIALVAVDLGHWALADYRVVRGIVLAHVIGMHRMCRIGRHTTRAGKHLEAFLLVSSQCPGRSSNDVRQNRPARTVAGAGTYLFVVKGHHDQNILALIVLGSILHRRQGGMYRRKIIHAPGCNELLSCPKDLTSGGIGRNQVEGCNILLADARLLPHYLQDRCLWVTDA